MSAQKVNTSTPWHVSFPTPHPLPSIYFKRANGWAHVYLLTRTIVGGGGRAGPELHFEGWVHVGGRIWAQAHADCSRYVRRFPAFLSRYSTATTFQMMA